MANELDERNEGGAELNTGAMIQSPFCGSLRSKKFFMLDTLATDAGQYIDASNHCWCRETQQVVGPDSGQVDPNRCVPGRTCYSSALESV